MVSRNLDSCLISIGVPGDEIIARSVQQAVIEIFQRKQVQVDLKPILMKGFEDMSPDYPAISDTLSGRVIVKNTT